MAKAEEILNKMQKKLHEEFMPDSKETDLIKRKIENYEEAQTFIKDVETELKIQDRRNLQFIYEIGRQFEEIKKICKEQKGKKFGQFIQSECVDLSHSYVCFYMGFYNLAKDFPRLLYVQVSKHFLNQNLSSIRYGLRNNQALGYFWAGRPVTSYTSRPISSSSSSVN